ncbi:dihydroorotase [Flavilitoribacter nigricans]|uniref:Dihydroorotase n=1 Tax=Flavilitoribacter nigricans (strain ATCC 23147 / DSM 23189 / NBRC 102662 / NCIMB 1420 / SS-2) TaxID=1122177 RepID=A0A2D0N8S2_FLAN2|nr:dihydroorotase [Flavilitoribacter nigricans]PHN04911.1 dihydroorotase [Flavilitoribacter nigricans DSM 23189 = NBRC 102662]
MKLLIRNATITDPNSSHQGEQLDLLIDQGVITRVGTGISVSDADDSWDLKGALLSPGWLDIGAQTGDPGLEHREDLEHAAEAAMAGGYTGVASFPNTQPCVHSKSEVHYILQRTRDFLVDFYPIGAVSQDCAGKEITEMLDMQAAGAVAFSDGKLPVAHAGLLMRALLYAKAFGGVILNHPHETSIIPGGQMHEGVVSTQLGMKGIPALAESLMVQRDIDILAYSESRLHLHNISTTRAVSLIRQAKKEGLQISCSVPALNLFFTEEDLKGFDSMLKVLPPLRTEEDRDALIAGLQDGTIDLITSNHVPLEVEAKQLEFSYAKFGAVGLGTAYAAARTALAGRLDATQLVEKFSIAPRKLLGLPVPVIAEGETANLTAFDPEMNWTLEKKDIRSRSKNSPFIGRELTGRALAVVRGDQSRILVDW